MINQPDRLPADRLQPAHGILLKGVQLFKSAFHVVKILHGVIIIAVQIQKVLDNDLVLGFEVGVKSALGNTDLFADIIDGDIVIAVLVKQLKRGLKKLLAGLLTLNLAFCLLGSGHGYPFPVSNFKITDNGFFLQKRFFLPAHADRRRLQDLNRTWDFDSYPV